MAFMKATKRNAPNAESSSNSPNTPPDEPSATGTTAKGNVVNIVVDRIEGSTIYSKDGKRFEINDSTTVIDSSRDAKKRTAELVFRNGTLAIVTFK